MKLLAIGDIVGRTGRKGVRELLPKIIEEESIDFVIANGENAAGGFGLTKEVVDELLSYGVDIITTGNHTWDNKDIFNFIDKTTKVIRPYNYSAGVPGNGFQILEKNSFKIAVINLIGRVYLGNYLCPFKELDNAIEELNGRVDLIVVDFHAEATAEKEALGWYADGRVSAVVGTHTHVQTADEKILPKGTAYITDLGMTGGVNSILGMNVKEPLERFLTQMPNRFKIATGDTKLSGLIIEFDDKTRRVVDLKRIAIIHTNN